MEYNLHQLNAAISGEWESLLLQTDLYAADYKVINKGLNAEGFKLAVVPFGVDAASDPTHFIQYQGSTIEQLQTLVTSLKKALEHEKSTALTKEQEHRRNMFEQYCLAMRAAGIMFSNGVEWSFISESVEQIIFKSKKFAVKGA